MRRFLLLSCLSAVLCGWAYENPVVGEDMPDPTVWRGADGVYYAASTHQDVYAGTDLVHWAKTGKKLLEASEYAWIKQTWPHVWAPDVVKIGDWYNLYICFHRGGKHTAIAAYRSKDPAGPFTEREILVRSEEDGRFEVIDPETVVDPDTGRVWLFFGHGCVRRVELTADGRRRKEGAKIEHVAGVPLGGRKEESVNGAMALSTEGPYLHRRGGKWYLFVSEGNWNDHTYRVSVGRADALDGTFVDKAGVPMTRGAATPILTSDKGDAFFGPGHNGEIFTLPSGRTYMFYHCHCAGASDAKGKYVPRPLFLQEILWGADGWPCFGNGGKPQKSCALTDAARSDALVLVAPGAGECVPLLTSKQRRFVDMDFAARAKYFVDANKALRSDMRTWGTTPRPVSLEWKGTAGPYEIAVRRRGATSAAFRTTVATNRVQVWNLEIGAEYEWTVTAAGETAKGWFVTDVPAPRFVKIDGVVNCRDLGGRVGLGGRRVRQGLVYRTAEYNRSTTKRNPPPSQTLITPEGKAELCGRLGVRTDLDLRRPDEYVGVTASPLGPDVAWICHHGSVFCYSNVVTSAIGREQFRKVFRVFTDAKNYPIAFHCRGGADRTGTVGLVLNALLGVGEEDLWKDYQVTAMWGTVGDTRHFRLFCGLLDAFGRYPGETLCARVEAYVRDLGFSDADIAAFRRIMLEDVARPELVARVARGELKAAKASWWGYDPVDSTRFLQAAIDSKVPTLTVDRQSGPWVVRPLAGVSDQRIEFEKGVEVVARRGAYRGRNDCLLHYAAASNVVLRGEGAVLRMWRADYRAAPYSKGEWRHALSLLSCADVTVEGLTLAESGGDGIYLGVCRAGSPCRNVTIRDCVCDRNYRQGISVISADGLLIERTAMRGTGGTPPAAGIDFEPNNPSELLRGCVMRDCVCADNEGASAEVYLGQLAGKSEPVSIRLENCRLSGAGRDGFRFANGASAAERGFPRGEVTLEGCVIENSANAGIVVRDNPIEAVRLGFRSCRLEGNGRRQPDGPDVSLSSRGFGGVVTDGLRFEDVTIRQPTPRPWITHLDTTWSERPVTAIGGTVCVTSPNGSATLALDDSWRRKTFGDAEGAVRPAWRPFDPATCTVEDRQPGVRTALVPLRPRGKARYVLFADRPRTLRFRCRSFEYEKGVKGKFRLTALESGRQVAAGTLPGAAGGLLEFAVTEPGFLALDVDMGRRNAFALTEGDAPTAIELPRAGQHFIGGGGRVGFVAPAQGPVAVVACGADGGEFVSVAVSDPSGAEVWRDDCVDGPSGWNSDTNVRTGMWSLKIGRPTSGRFEDHYLALRGVTPLLVLSSGTVWRQR